MDNPQGEVHTLIYGLPPCGFSDKTPIDWPPGHRWTEYWNLDDITCGPCKEATEKYLKTSRISKSF